MEITTRKSQFAQQIKMKWYLWFHNSSHSCLSGRIKYEVLIWCELYDQAEKLAIDELQTWLLWLLTSAMKLGVVPSWRREDTPGLEPKDSIRFKLINMVKKVLPRFFGKTRQSDFPGCYTPLNEDDLPFVLFLIQTGFMFVVKVVLLRQQETLCEILVSVWDTMVLRLHTKEVWLVFLKEQN